MQGWLWFLIGAIVIIGLVVVAAVLRYMGAGRKVVTGGWVGQAIDAYHKGSALRDAMSAAVQTGALAGQDGAARWSDIQGRADVLDQALQALRGKAVDPEDRASSADALGALRAARSAIEAYRDAGGGAEQAELVRRRLAVFEESLKALRSPLRHLR